MDFSLTTEQQRIQLLARDFAQQEVAPLARESDESGTFQTKLVRRMGELGFLGATFGREYGGSALDHVSYVAALEELGRVDSSVRGFLTVHAGLVAGCVAAFGSEEQMRRYLPKLASGEMIGCYCLTEPEAGSDAASIQTTARVEGDDYVLKGQKIWITNGNVAGLAIVFASRDYTERHRGICAFLVEPETPGF
ncbi:MAG TPA: acyl-CoA dehydrogenase family protein, partial [Ktedonobacterales bacterium]|nr:acyl-CoA dehydrogenase family protein [Ktedonobacterales bacterium]